MRKIKILHVLVGLNIGGCENLLSEVLPRLDRGFYDMKVCSLKGWGPIGEKLRKFDIEVMALDGKGKFDMRVIWKLYLLMKKEKYDMVHSYLFYANVATRIAAFFSGVPVVISSVRDTDVWMKWYHVLLDKITSKYADYITTCSNAVKEFKVKQLGINKKKFFTIYNGVDVEKFKPSSSSEAIKISIGLNTRDPVVGMVGRLIEPKKGIQYFIKAARKILERYPKVQFLIVGDGPSRASLKKLAASLRISTSIHFIGERKDVSSILPAMDVFVLPSLWEGFGIVLIEAMAAERPVIATEVGGVIEVVKNNLTGILVPPKNATAIANAIHIFLNNPDHIRTMGRNGRIRVEENFSIEKTVSATDEFYRRIIAEKLLVLDGINSTVYKKRLKYQYST